MPAKPLNQLSGMPQMSAAFEGWMIPITLQKIMQEVIDGFVQDETIDITFNGTVQPLSPDAIKLKPEGQRSWEWLQIHCFSGAQNLVTNDRVLYNGKPFKIMAVLDYSLNNYIEYHLVKDYTGTQ